MRDYLPRAVAYIRDNADELEGARLAGLLGRERPEPRAVRGLFSRQNEDGGFPYLMVPGRPSAVTATATALHWLQDLRSLHLSQADRAAAYLLTVQRPDGAWDESPAILKYDPPPLARPGHAAGRLYVTGIAALWLTRLLGPGHESVRRGTAFLRQSRDGTWPEDEPVQVSVVVTAATAAVEGIGSPAALAGVEALTRVPPESWGPDRLADLLGALYAAGFGAEDPLVAWSLRRLSAMQRDDGGWTSEHGADRDVDLSLRALAALLVFGVTSG